MLDELYKSKFIPYPEEINNGDEYPYEMTTIFLMH